MGTLVWCAGFSLLGQGFRLACLRPPRRWSIIDGWRRRAERGHGGHSVAVAGGVGQQVTKGGMATGWGGGGRRPSQLLLLQTLKPALLFAQREDEPQAQGVRWLLKWGL